MYQSFAYFIAFFIPPNFIRSTQTLRFKPTFSLFCFGDLFLGPSSRSFSPPSRFYSQSVVNSFHSAFRFPNCSNAFFYNYDKTAFLLSRISFCFCFNPPPYTLNYARERSMVSNLCQASLFLLSVRCRIFECVDIAILSVIGLFIDISHIFIVLTVCCFCLSFCFHQLASYL